MCLAVRFTLAPANAIMRLHCEIADIRSEGVSSTIWTREDRVHAPGDDTVKSQHKGSSDKARQLVIVAQGIG
jgi:hypothetical protein